jgi:serine/threonine protein kinase
MKGSDKSRVISEETLLGSIGVDFRLQERLGGGAFGDVFRCTDENNNELAAKICETDEEGIPNILEASIMTTIYHPNLNRAVQVYSVPGKLYIIQDLARCDLSRHVRKLGHRPHVEQLKDWLYSISHALLCLHKQNIIHADVKASNVLLYADGSIRLSDYTLSVKKWFDNECFTSVVCTSTHRPLEVFMRSHWAEPVDIWSLGCTFFELAYGDLLFPYQGHLEPVPYSKIVNTKEKRDARHRIAGRSINCLLDWALRGPNTPETVETLAQFTGSPTISYNDVEYLPFKLPVDFNRPEYKDLNRLILQMLQTDPWKRPDISQIVNDPFFAGMQPPNRYYVITTPPVRIPTRERDRIDRYINRYTDNTLVKRLALELYARSLKLNLNEHTKIAAAIWVASKLILSNVPKSIKLPAHQILMAERGLCHSLFFRLHSLSDK